MSAQDAEVILDIGDGGQAGVSNRIEDSEDENTAPESTWRGCETDDEADFEASSTPKRKMNVVIYTPSRTWVAADVDAEAQLNSQPSLPAEEPIADAGDDNVSVFSMTDYGSMDWDHTGDELDEMQVTPKITRRGSTTSLNNQIPVFHELDPVTPRKKTGSTSSTSTSEKKPTSLQRDSKGRFAPKSSSSASSQTSASIKAGSRRTPTPSNSATPFLVRDAHGRFTPKNGTPAKRRASMGSSAVEKAPRSLIRDKHGKFAPNNETAKRRASMGSSAVEKALHSVLRDEYGKFAPKNEPPTVTLSKRYASMGSSASDKTPRSLERDSKGRFALKNETPVPPPQPLAKRRASTSGRPDESPVVTRDAKGKFAPKETPVPPPKRLKPAKDSKHLPPQAVMDENGLPQGKAASKPAKAKKAPAKSPYFVPPTPPISPEMTRKSKGQKESGTDTAGEPTTPRKGDVPSSPGSGKKRPSAKTVSCIPFPPLSAPHFGLIQEKLAREPFRLLIAVTFLIRTHGKHAIPVFFDLMEKYPTPESLVAANKEEILHIIRHLGLQNQRASTYQMYAKIWLEDPPTKGKRYLVRGYPYPESARDVKKGEILNDDDERDAWEIGHMTQGPYAIDSWRIFCRDKLRGEADSWNGEGRGEGFQPEWMRVLPEDKELRAYLRWMWLKEGFEWDPFTGDKEVARPELMRAAMEGRIAWDDQGGMRILDEPMSASPAKSDSTTGSDAEKSRTSTPVVKDSEDSEDELA